MKLYENQIKAEKNKQFMSLKPEILIDISENSPNQLAVTITSTKPNSNKIEDLYFTFDIPGRFVQLTRQHKDRVGESKVSPSFLVGNHWGTLAETIYVVCSAIYPSGSYSFTIEYSPTELSEQPADESHPQRNVFLDLHDYSRLFYFWTFDGKTQVVRDHLDLRNLKYIQRDNEALIRAFRNERFHEYLQQHGIEVPSRPHEEKWSKQYVDDMERKRAGLL